MNRGGDRGKARTQPVRNQNAEKSRLHSNQRNPTRAAPAQGLQNQEHPVPRKLRFEEHLNHEINRLTKRRVRCKDEVTRC
jgi:hypothetical protein